MHWDAVLEGVGKWSAESLRSAYPRCMLVSSDKEGKLVEESCMGKVLTSDALCHASRGRVQHDGASNREVKKRSVG